MSQQFTFADSEFSSKRRQTRKEIFLSRMDNLQPSFVEMIYCLFGTVAATMMMWGPRIIGY